MLQLQTVTPDTLELLKEIFFRALLSLTYFDDAEIQAMPKMFISQTWDEMKSYISNKVKENTII